MKALSPEQQFWYWRLSLHFPRTKPKTLRYNARRIAANKSAPLLKAIPDRPAEPARDITEGLPDGAAYWWDARGHGGLTKPKPFRKGRPEITLEELQEPPRMKEQ